VLLNYLFPEADVKWTAHNMGTFYRNYNQDVLTYDAEQGDVSMSRDGFLNLLPQGFISNDDDMKDVDNIVDNYESVERRRHLLQETFLPFDTFAFWKKLELEQQAASLLETKVEYVLKQYFDYDITAEPDPLVRQAAVLLPFISQKRGDFGFIGNLLSALLQSEVLMQKGRYSHIDSSVCWLPKVKYEVLVDGLSTEEYVQLSKKLQPLCDFISEWMVPFEVVCEIVVKEHGSYQQTNTRLTLDYNTEMPAEKQTEK